MIGAAHLMMRQGVSQPKGLFGWGDNGAGNLGLGDTTSRSSPVLLGSASDWVAFSMGGMKGYMYVATLLLKKSNGTIWSCGYNAKGFLGLGDITKRSSPCQIGTDTDWSKISSGAGIEKNTPLPVEERNCCGAIKTNGTLWLWGANYNGQLGQGDRTHRSSPAQVGSDTDWAEVYPGASVFAIKSTGTLWAWGKNDLGQLGLTDRTDRSSPVQVGAGTTWSAIANGGRNVLALKSDGTLWAWGYNTYGQLGLGDISNRSSPVQVGSDTDWSKVATEDHVLAIKSGGTLWAWGRNYNGQLGFGDVNDRSSPAQVGSDTNWSLVLAGDSFSVAIRTTGTLWSWGNNTYGALGQGDQGNARSSPAQVGSGTNWSNLSLLYSTASAVVRT